MKLVDADAVIRKQRESMESLYAKSIPELMDHIGIDDGAMVYMLALENYAKTKQWYHYLKAVLEGASEVDTQPVVHGKWLNAGDWALAKCSECGEVYDASDEPCEKHFKLFGQSYRYCPNCGAKMDEGAIDG